MKKVLIIGATGMLGHMVYLYLKSLYKYELYNTVYRNKLTEDSILCNVHNKKDLNIIIDNIKPDIVINCVGALIQDSKEKPEKAIYLNALFPHLLKTICNDIGAKLIHISTDCVFSGKKGNYAENDFRDADDIYGRSKALGEIFESPHCTLRTSIIGPELKENGTGLFHWFMNQKSEINGYSQAFWGGVSTLELAKKISIIIDNDMIGLFQVSNGMPISKYHLLNLFKEIFDKNVLNINKKEDYSSNKSLKQSERFNFKVANYENMVLEMKQFMLNNNQFYTHYEF